MKYFKKTFIWIIVFTVLAGYYYIDLKQGKIREKAKAEATRLLPFEPAQTVKIRLEKAEVVMELERWEEGWKIIKPVQAPAVNEKVEEFLKYITDSRNDSDYVMDANPSEERLKEFGLDKPEVTVTLYVGMELKPHTINFGNRAPTKGVAFAQLKGDPKVYRVLADAKAQANQDTYFFRHKQVVGYDPEKVEKVAFSGKDGQILCELPMDGKWRIVEPMNVRADIVKVMELLTAFKNSEIKEFIEEEPPDLVKYGFKPESQKITFWAGEDGKPTSEILFGTRDKKKRGVFARLNGKKNVVLLDDKLLDYFPIDPFILMNKEVFFFQEEEVLKVRVSAVPEIREFEKTPDYNWKQTVPREKAVDFNPIMAFLQKIKGVTIRKYQSGNPSLFKLSGLNQPSYKVMIWKKGSEKEEWLSIGSMKEEEGYFAMSEGRPGIAVIDRKAASDIKNFLGEMK